MPWEQNCVVQLFESLFINGFLEGRFGEHGE